MAKIKGFLGEWLEKLGKVEPVYFTPIEVLADTIDESAVIANPPYDNAERSI